MELTLQEPAKETLSGFSTNRENYAKVDVAEDGFWGTGRERAFYCRVFNPFAPTGKTPYHRLIKHKKGRKRNILNEFMRLEASLLSEKWDQPYCITIGWLRCTLCFFLLPSIIQCIRGARSSKGQPEFHLPNDMVESESDSRFCMYMAIAMYILFLFFFRFFLFR